MEFFHHLLSNDHGEWQMFFAAISSVAMMRFTARKIAVTVVHRSAKCLRKKLSPIYHFYCWSGKLGEKDRWGSEIFSNVYYGLLDIEFLTEIKSYGFEKYQPKEK